MKGYDAFAGVIKSGGKTRRAAKMVILNAEHPDIVEFINCKVEEEKKAWALIDAGYDGSFTGTAYSSVFFQNSNNSVRVTDEFLSAVEDDKDWNLTARLDADLHAAAGVTQGVVHEVAQQYRQQPCVAPDPGLGRADFETQKMRNQEAAAGLELEAMAHEREQALQQIGREFPAHYREAIEQYFKRLAAGEQVTELERTLVSLDRDVADRLKGQLIPMEWLLGLGAVFVTGAAMILAGLFLPAAVTGAMAYALPALGLVGTGLASLVTWTPSCHAALGRRVKL